MHFLSNFKIYIYCLLLVYTVLRTTYSPQDNVTTFVCYCLPAQAASRSPFHFSYFTLQPLAVSAVKSGVWCRKEILDLLALWGDARVQQVLKTIRRNRDCFQETALRWLPGPLTHNNGVLQQGKINVVAV